MQTLWVILACFAGLFAFAFLLAGVLGLQDFKPPTDKKDTFLQLIDATLLGSLSSILRGLSNNWSTHPDERRFIYAGLFSFLALIAFASLAAAAP